MKDALFIQNEGTPEEMTLDLSEAMRMVARASSTSAPNLIADLITLLTEKGVISPEEAVMLIPRKEREVVSIKLS